MGENCREEEEEEAYEPVEEICFSSKIVLAGSSGVGKTSIINRAFERTFSNDVKPTVGSGFRKGVFRIKNKRITMEVWDTAGQEQFNSMAPLFFTNAAAAILVYDITDHKSFDVLANTYINMVHDRALPNCVVGIVGNKVDLVQTSGTNQNSTGAYKQREVSYEEAENFCEQINAGFHLEVSALTGVGVDSIFELIAENPNLQSNANKKSISSDTVVIRESPVEKKKGCKC